MLRRLEIKNFAVISHCIFEPLSGLNVISGETGAGKSLLIDAIGLILGCKASRNLIRTNADKALVEAVFDFNLVNDSNRDSAKLKLEEAGIEFDDDNLIVSREISSDGRSVARINGRTVVLSVLKEITSMLVDIHGQNDTQQIFDDSTHVKLLDGYIGSAAISLLNEYRLLLNQYKEIVMRIRSLSSSPETRKMRKEYLSHAIEEITKANLKDGEEDKLYELKKFYTSSAKISTILEQVNELIGLSDQSSCSKVKIAAGLMSKLDGVTEQYKALSMKLESLSLDLEAISNEIASEYQKMDSADIKLDEINDRISLIFDLKSKYGNTIEEIKAYADNAVKEIDAIDNTDSEISKLKHRRAEIEGRLLEVSSNLSNIRHEHALILGERIVKELVDLEMPNSKFVVEFKEHPKEKYFSLNGTEDITFSFSANPGESLKPLSKIVSGGEASRIMLAIKTILSEVDDTCVLVFDEIDTGISGVASLKVAEKLRKISSRHQVLSVSHTAQIAAAADSNFFIHKEISEDRSSTDISFLDSDGKLKEVSRLLSGTSDTESLDLAKSLITRFS